MFHVKHRRASLLLVLALALGCLSPALAAEGDAVAFSDVPANAWYAPYVEVCVERGLMQGVGDGKFAPDEDLSCDACSVLLLRLHDLLRGGDGVFDPAPAGWEPIQVTDETGRVLFSAQDYAGYGFGRGEARLYFCPKDPDALAGAPGTLEMGCLSFPGTFVPGEGERQGRVALTFSNPESLVAVGDVIEACFYIGRRKDTGLPAWLEDAWYYARQNDLDGVVRLAGHAELKCLAADLTAVCGELPKLYDVDYIAHVDRAKDPAVYALYEAGVLTGSDRYGAVHVGGSHLLPERKITRAMAAAIMARILDPALRAQQPPSPLPTEGYTLTYLADGAEPDATYPVLPLENGLLTLDGQLVPYPRDGEAETPPHLVRAANQGEYLHLAVPGKPRRGGHAVGGAGCISEIYVWVDAAGQAVTPFSYSDIEPPQSPAFDRPYAPSDWGIYYQGDRPVSQKFDWCGLLDRKLRGFVGLDGKIYRIQFER